MKMVLKDVKTRLVRARNFLRHKYIDDFLFVRINKTGGSSVKWALQLPIGHTTALEYIDKIGRQKWDNKFTFSIVRNPWDRVVSQYHYRVKTNQTNLGTTRISFRDWVKLVYQENDSFYYDKPKMFMPQLDWLIDRNGEVLVEYILRFENLNDDFDTLCKKLGKSAKLPHIKSTKRANYQDYYDNDTFRIVEKWFKKDIFKFEYKF